jgi:AcrR family transcriptional regulator
MRISSAAASRKAASEREDATQSALVATALGLFAREGVKAVSLRRITAEAGASNQSAVHYHFSNKLGLIRAVLDDINTSLAPLQDEALAEVAAIARRRKPTVREIVAIGFGPYLALYMQSEQGRLCLRFLSRLTWESGDQAQELMLQKVRPYFLKLLPFLQKALPRKPLEALDFQLFMAAANLIHGLADITLLGRQLSGNVAQLYQRRPQDMIDYFYDYISAGLSSTSS